MLTISREADYAVRLVVHMAALAPHRLQARTLAEAERIPESFLFKILRVLMRHRVVRSYRGVYGGYQLEADPAKLTLYRLLEIVEGPVGLNACVAQGLGCELTAGCGVHDVWVTAQAQFRQTLEGATVADLARRTVEKRRLLAERAKPVSPAQGTEEARL
ncbi:MAG: Rrf2 family transcriptional regulator [Acidobacteria bacterium]|nr:Rrf2 family transcriptional regulator [Acidobacteriota bacterium]